MNPAFNSKLSALRAEFSSHLPQRFQQITSEWNSWVTTCEDDDQLFSLYRDVHSLAGAAATFGYKGVSDVARSMQDLLKNIMNDKRPPTDAEQEQIDTLIGKLSIEYDAGKVDPADPPQVKEPVTNVTVGGKEANSATIFLVESDDMLSRSLYLQLRPYGYKLLRFRDLAGFERGLGMERPDVVIMGMELPDGDSAEYLAVMRSQNDTLTDTPCIFLSCESAVENRLKAVRSGGEAYFVKPLDTSSLVEQLDIIVSDVPEEPYRILVVDDSAAVSGFISETLKKHGMMTHVINKPLEIMDALEEINPDLILMDLYMPECTGLELARVIRQLEEYLSVPIVYLSSEKDVSKQLTAMGVGGDDFLTKPIKEDHLVAAVTNRARRARALRSLMMRDSLTGLFNHTTIKEKLASEVLRAKRLEKKLVFAMIDIDNFKQINDTYGHPIGDTVIKSVARILQQRLRRTDVVGRYGGEEFSVILLDTGIEDAQRIIDSIRDDFSKLEHCAGEECFKATFSIGLAEYPAVSSVKQLQDHADEALYQAKHGGRNKLVVHGT